MPADCCTTPLPTRCPAQDTAAEVVEGLQGTSLFLVGMMGSGKSTVGKLVSKALGYCFFDTGGRGRHSAADGAGGVSVACSSSRPLCCSHAICHCCCM